ncbi:MAG: A/G-specific adenine glycosylase [Isosphaeraceae bacterium]|nr:A/G-specific adenine glycosylase [Isosphaeraceae bacterium]
MSGKRSRRAAEISDQGPDLDPAWVSSIRARLLQRNAAEGRQLPWRVDRTAYRVLVSEMMLVQTTVAAVVPYFERFLRRFPDFAALASAAEDEVLSAWEGLGYYRRARMLHAAARRVMEVHGGELPADLEAIADLPGVGRYITGAIASFAFDMPAPILEANTQRVAARWIGWDGELGSSATQARLWRLAERVVPEVSPGAFNEAFMDLGATLCTPRRPACLLCPVSSLCRARIDGREDSIPVMAPRTAPKSVEEMCGIITRPSDSALLMVRRGPGGLWERFWELPTIHVAGADPAGRAETSGLAFPGGIELVTGIKVEEGAVLRSIRYSVTTHRVALRAILGVPVSGDPRPGPGMIDAAWVDRAAVESKTVPAPIRRLIGDWLESSAD